MTVSFPGRGGGEGGGESSYPFITLNAVFAKNGYSALIFTLSDFLLRFLKCIGHRAEYKGDNHEMKFCQQREFISIEKFVCLANLEKKAAANLLFLL